MYSRRDVMKLLLMGASAMEMDPELLLWTPNKSRVVVPAKGLTVDQIVATEVERMMPILVNIFERDDMFYKAIKEGTKAKRLEAREINVPLRMGRDWGER
jgi:hypothetical protein